MKRISKKQKLIVSIAIILIAVILAIVITTNIISNNSQIENEGYFATTANASSNLVAGYIKEGITIGGITGTLKILDTSDADATPEDIAKGKTAYVKGEKITGTYMILGMTEVGDYIEYIPDKVNDYSLSSTVSGYTSNQTIPQENLMWQVLSKNNDGTIDLVSATTSTVYLENAVGYNNGVFVLNDISKHLYSNKNLGATARNMTIEDIEKHMTEEGINYVHSYKSERWYVVGKNKNICF